MAKKPTKKEVPIWAWIVMAVMAFVIFVMYLNINYSGNGPFEDKDEKRVRALLEDDNYEVISVTHLSNYKTALGNESVIVDMKSFGNTGRQVENAFLWLNYVYPEIEDYSVTIYTPDKTCYWNTYFMAYNDLRKARRNETVYVKLSEYNNKPILGALNFEVLAQDVEKYDGYPLGLEEYPKLNALDLSRIVNYQYNDPSSCK